MNVREFCVVIGALLALHSSVIAEEASDSDGLASEFKGVKLIKLSTRQDGDFGYRCYLYTDTEHKQMLEEFKASSEQPVNSALRGTYLVLEVKKDRLVLAPEIWNERGRVRVVPLRYISDIYRAGVYERAEK